MVKREKVDRRAGARRSLLPISFRGPMPYDAFKELGEREDILRGLQYPALRRRRAGTAGGGTIIITPTPPLTVASTTALNTVIGTPSVVGGQGTYIFTLTDPSGQFTIVGGNIVVASALTPGVYNVTINGNNSAGDTPHLNFQIIVTAAYVPTYPYYGF